MRTRTKWVVLAGLATASLALVHCVGDDPSSPGGGGDDAGSDVTQQGDSVVPPTDSGNPVDAGADSACAAGVSPCIVQIAGGGQTFCARDDAQNVYCWGSNTDGQLGVDPKVTPFSTKPLKVALTKHAVSIDVGGPRNLTDLGQSVVCARVQMTAGTPVTVECWGADNFGQLAAPPDAGPYFDDAGYAYNFQPTEVTGVSGIAEIAVSATHVCAVSGTNAAFCWGDNLTGELERPSARSFDPTPAQVQLVGVATPQIDLMAAGYRHSCSTNKAAADRVACSGENTVDELGNGVSSPGENFGDAGGFAVDGPVNNVTFIESNGYSTCAIFTTGGVKCWGENGHSELGTGAASPFSNPVTPVGLNGASRVITIQNGFDHACAILAIPDPADGGVRQNVWCWGDNGNGQAGQGVDGGPVLIPTPVAGLPDKAIGIASGSQASCALVNGGTVWCWGENYEGELGNRNDGGNDTASLTPGQVEF